MGGGEGGEWGLEEVEERAIGRRKVGEERGCGTGGERDY